jgi:hypothetical protein
MQTESLNNSTVSFYNVQIAPAQWLDRDLSPKAWLIFRYESVNFGGQKLLFQINGTWVVKKFSEFSNTFSVSVHNVHIASAQRLDWDFSPKAWLMRVKFSGFELFFAAKTGFFKSMKPE